MIIVLPNGYARQSAQRLMRDGFVLTTQRIGRMNVNVARRVPTLTNVVEMRRKQR